jgi:hypothetical protein
VNSFRDSRFQVLNIVDTNTVDTLLEVAAEVKVLRREVWRSWWSWQPSTAVEMSHPEIHEQWHCSVEEHHRVER